MTVRIVELVETPKELLNVAQNEVTDVSTVTAVVFGAFLDITAGHIGTYIQEAKTAFIDLGNAMHDNALYNAGMMFIPGIWCSVLWAIGHEIEHARQVEAEPSLIRFNKLPQEYEDAAMQAGEDLVLEWTEVHKVPPVTEMGWLGKQLVVMLNALYTKNPNITDEVDYLSTGAAAPLEAVFATHEFTEKGKQYLVEDIDAGKIGVCINGKRFLTANEFLGL